MIAKRRKKKKSLENIFFQVFFVFFSIGIVIFLIVSNLRINRKREKLISQINTLQEEIQILEEKNERLKANISQTEQESYLEEEARERLGLKKPGEEVVAIKKIEAEEEPEQPESEKGLWQKILEKIQFWRD